MRRVAGNTEVRLPLFTAAFAALAWATDARAEMEAGEESVQQELAEAIENTSERIDVVGDRLAQLGDRALELLPLLGVAFVTVLVFWLLARLLTKGDWLFRWIDNGFLRDTARHLTRIVVIAVGVLLALELLDATALVGATLGAAGVVGIAVGFAFRDIVENYLAGLLLSMRHPFQPNDFVSIDGDEGKVVRLTSRATILLTLAGNHLRIPNSKVFKAVLVNYTQNPLRQFDFEVGVGVNEDLAAVQKRGLDVLTAMDAILKEPPPHALIERFGDSNIPIHFFAWVDQRETDYFKAKSAAMRLVKTAFDASEIEMPEPIYQVFVKQDVKSPAEQVVQPSAEVLKPGDTAADDRLDAQIELERAEGGPDLLDEDAPHE
ncbi:MAG: mechanosensitive ion channel family protein [Deltaproteobacteria bacterium]|nr:MAG: mechanosensitive ion channel family protein [Deltaproteobacteria bacterium]